jgi:hypothetical protein
MTEGLCLECHRPLPVTDFRRRDYHPHCWKLARARRLRERYRTDPQFRKRCQETNRAHYHACVTAHPA